MKPTEFCNKYRACSEGREFALQFSTMAEVWDACVRPDWLFWILEKHAPLEKDQSVRLAIAFAETCLGRVPANESRPAAAIRAAKAWLENPCEETQRDAAYAAADAAYAARVAYAAYAARVAYAAYAARVAYAAYAAAQCGIIRKVVKNPFLP